MANRNIFRTLPGKQLPRADTTNSEGSPAYALSPKHALAQLAVTGCLRDTFYVTAETQLEQLFRLCDQVFKQARDFSGARFILKLALYAHEHGYMKDTPAALLAWLTAQPECTRDPEFKEEFARAFSQICRSGKMLRNYVQILRSGVTGRKSLGSFPRRLIRVWLDRKDPVWLLNQSVGSQPSLADVIRMAHPKPSSPSQRALFAYLIGREYAPEHLPFPIQHWERFKADPRPENLPEDRFDFRLYTGLGPLPPAVWRKIGVDDSSWQTLRQNLNTLARHKVFAEFPETVQQVADKLSDPEAIKLARVFPFQLMAAFLAVEPDPCFPVPIKLALATAMEHAVENVPSLEYPVLIFPDVSPSMDASITGSGPVESKISCCAAAALIAAVFLRKNPDSLIIPFHDQAVIDPSLSRPDTILTTAQKIQAHRGGGTNCSSALAAVNQMGGIRAGLVLYISDNESWVDASDTPQSTATMEQWRIFQRTNPDARLVNINLTPVAHTQTQDSSGKILNIGGFSDIVFRVIEDFCSGKVFSDALVQTIDQRML